MKSSRLRFWSKPDPLQLAVTDSLPAVCHSSRTLFIHIPKTAGTSLCLSLYGYQLGHTKLVDYAKRNPQAVASYFKFAICRDPLDRAYSTYRFLKRGGMTQEDRRWKAAHFPEAWSFGDFLQATLVSKQVPMPIHLIEQHKFVEKYPMGPCGVDLVIRLEELDAGLPRLEQALGRPLPMPHLNRGGEAGARAPELDDPKARQIVAEFYERDYWMFGYDLPA